MTNVQIQSALMRHGVTTVVDSQGHVKALDEYTIQGVLCGNWIDVTGYSVADLRNFLGYDNVEDQINYN